MAYNNRAEAEKVLEVALGIEDRKYKGMWLSYHILEMYSGDSVWRRKPMGKFQLNLPGLYKGDREKLFRTKGEKNEFDIPAIRAYLDSWHLHRSEVAKREEQARDIKTNNKPIAERVKAAYNGKGYISDYRSSHGGKSIVASESQEGVVRIGWEFALTEEKAMRLMAFINQLEAE